MSDLNNGFVRCDECGEFPIIIPWFDECGILEKTMTLCDCATKRRLRSCYGSSIKGLRDTWNNYNGGDEGCSVSTNGN